MKARPLPARPPAPAPLALPTPRRRPPSGSGRRLPRPCRSIFIPTGTAAAAPRCTPWSGKFLAFTQPGTTLCGDGTHPTCLNYLQQLGVGYVQIMPMYDFGSVDEAKPLTKQYNWGYDPINFNVPEGSYSTDPYHGEVRIRECRTRIQALHKAGIGVIMDVVYNHTYRHENVLNHVMPGYFFRENEDGSYSDGSGCSNEFASERPMARRYLIDSVLYWAKEYHLDGFRFDLMEIYDVETMNLLRAALDELPGGESILMYGEPWKGGPSVLQQPAANKDALSLLDDRIGVFCDNTRDAIKGHCFYAREAGYVNGRPARSLPAPKKARTTAMPPLPCGRAKAPSAPVNFRFRPAAP